MIMCFSEGTCESDTVFINEAPHKVQQRSASLIVKGRLKLHVEFRKSIGRAVYIKYYI